MDGGERRPEDGVNQAVDYAAAAAEPHAECRQRRTTTLLPLAPHRRKSNRARVHSPHWGESFQPQFLTRHSEHQLRTRVRTSG